MIKMNEKERLDAYEKLDKYFEDILHARLCGKSYIVQTYLTEFMGE